MTRETFYNAPITEALIDIQITLPPETDLTQLFLYHEKILHDFPEKKERNLFQSNIQFTDGEVPEVINSKTPDGLILTSPEGSKILQISLNSFSFHKLRPYSNWREFVSEGRKLWSEFLVTMQPSAITRLGLRYINRIEIPLPIHDMSKYILTRPTLSPEIDYPLLGFFMRSVIQDPSTGVVGIITETTEQGSSEVAQLPLIFDIDVFWEGSLNPQEEKVWELFDTMREIKNTLFFNSFTEETKGRFRS